MKKITLILFSVLTVSIAQSQQIPMFSQYYQTPFIYNPAYTGSTGNTSAYLVDHSQWTAIPGGPDTKMVAIDGSIIENKAGLGAVVYNDVTDITSRIGAYGSYSYKLKTSENTSLSFGLALGIIDSKIDFSKVIVKDANDMSLFGQSQNKTSFDGNAGLMFAWKKLQIGFSVPQLLDNNIVYSDNYSRSVYLMGRNYLTSVKYSFTISKENNIHCSPLVLVRYMPNTPIQYDINALFDWKDVIGAGVIYKSNYAVTGEVYFKIHQSFTIGYAYDYILSNITSYAGANNELLLGYTFGMKKKKELEKLQQDVDELKKKSADNATLKKQVADDKELINKNSAKADSLQKQIDQLKADMQKPTVKTEPSDKDANTIADTKAMEADKDKSANKAPDNAPVSPLKIGTADKDGVRIISKKDFNDKTGKPIKEGYYVVIGTFYYDEYANAEVTRFKGKGYPNTAYIFYTPLHYHYVYVDLLQSRDAAMELLKKVKYIESDACIMLDVTE